MDRLISEKSLLDKIDEWKGFDTVTIRLSTLRNIVKAIPSAEPKTGQWKRRIVDGGYNADWKCSECGYKVYTDFVNYNYCPNCGARMIDPQESEG